LNSSRQCHAFAAHYRYTFPAYRTSCTSPKIAPCSFGVPYILYIKKARQRDKLPDKSTTSETYFGVKRTSIF
jgi:hypothetical protein